MMDRNKLNEIYCKLDGRTHELVKPFIQANGIFNYSRGYFNGHYSKNETGEYEKDYFPIPVISIEGVCDIEINLDSISVSTKLLRNTVFTYDFGKLLSYNFEAYGVENYLDDFYIEGNTIADLLENVQKSMEETIGFTFYFPYESDGGTLYEFVKFLHAEEFFY